jgi:hypothetical protein
MRTAGPKAARSVVACRKRVRCRRPTDMPPDRARSRAEPDERSPSGACPGCSPDVRVLARSACLGGSVPRKGRSAAGIRPTAWSWSWRRGAVRGRSCRCRPRCPLHLDRPLRHDHPRHVGSVRCMLIRSRWNVLAHNLDRTDRRLSPPGSSPTSAASRPVRTSTASRSVSHLAARHTPSPCEPARSTPWTRCGLLRGWNASYRRRHAT